MGRAARRGARRPPAQSAGALVTGQRCLRPRSRRVARRRPRRHLLQFRDPAPPRHGRQRRQRANSPSRSCPLDAVAIWRLATHRTLAGRRRDRRDLVRRILDGCPDRRPVGRPGRATSPSPPPPSCASCGNCMTGPRRTSPITAEVLPGVFYRNKGAYVIGRLRSARGTRAAGARAHTRGAWRGPRRRAHESRRDQRRLRLHPLVLPRRPRASGAGDRVPRVDHAGQARGRALDRHRLPQARQDRLLSHAHAPPRHARRALRGVGGRPRHGDGRVHPAVAQRRVQGHQGPLRPAQDRHARPGARPLRPRLRARPRRAGWPMPRSSITCASARSHFVPELLDELLRVAGRHRDGERRRRRHPSRLLRAARDAAQPLPPRRDAGGGDCP